MVYFYQLYVSGKEENYLQEAEKKIQANLLITVFSLIGYQIANTPVGHFLCAIEINSTNCGKSLRSNSYGGSIITKKEGSTIYYDPGLWRYDGKNITRVSHRGAYHIIQDKNGNIWTSGEVNQKLWALTRYDSKSLYHQVPDFTEIRSGRPMAFLHLLETADGSIWYGSGSGIHRYDGKDFTDFNDR